MRGPLSPSRVAVRDLFVRLLGLTFLAAFASLLSQVTLLFGARGLLPAADFLARVAGRVGFRDIPTIFWWTGASDGALVAVALAGIAASVLIVAGVATRGAILVAWALYLSFVSVGQDFLSFQWDTLLLESAFFSLFVAPRGLRARRRAALGRGGAAAHDEPPPAGVFLMLWLVFRLHVESGLAKLLTGDPTWRDLTAMATYYQTAPIPTSFGWYVHQLPMWAHKACSLFTFVVEIALPLLIWVPARRVRGAVFVVFVAMQVSIIATANYGFFNYLSAALCLWVLDDGHLRWVVERFPRGLGRWAERAIPSIAALGGGATPEGITEERGPAPAPARWRGAALVALAVAVVPLSIVPFVRFFRAPGLARAVEPLRREMSNWRSLNAYHLFASMTLVRREAVIEGSNDGETWETYEFRWKPGDPRRAPPFVAPHQPRVDFQLWFLLLGGRPSAGYFNTLLARLLDDPKVVAPLFSRNPFPHAPPRLLRVGSYRYEFTGPAERRATKAWWRRDLEQYSPAFGAEALRGADDGAPAR